MYHWPGSGTHNIKWWLMLHMQLMMAWRVILGLWWLWAKELSMDHLHANELTLRVQLKVNLLRSMIWCLKYFGQGSHKDTKFTTHYCIKIIRECNEFWENFRGSSGQRICHCFFTKDRIASGEVKLKYCPTETILADAFTKPLQEKARHSGETNSKVGVSWAQGVDYMVPAIPTLATGVKVSSSVQKLSISL